MVTTRSGNRSRIEYDRAIDDVAAELKRYELKCAEAAEQAEKADAEAYATRIKAAHALECLAKFKAELAAAIGLDD